MSESVLVFIGAKEVATLNRYRDAYDIKFFSRGIDFSFYILSLSRSLSS